MLQRVTSLASEWGAAGVLEACAGQGTSTHGTLEAFGAGSALLLDWCLHFIDVHTWQASRISVVGEVNACVHAAGAWSALKALVP